jgi:mono/diheme cytochrome c family protein
MSFRNFVMPALLLGSTLLACAPALYLPTEEVARTRSKNLDDLKQGRQAYIDHCGSCHNLYLPSQFSAADWAKNVHAMHTRAKTDTVQQRLILDYILAGK